MPHRPLIVMILFVLLGGCGARSEFDDPVAALEAAGRAQAEKNLDKAVVAYQSAVANAGDQIEIKYEALLGLGEVQAGRKEDLEAAKATFARVEKECASVYDARGAQRIIDAWIRRGDVQLATSALEAAKARFPDERDAFESRRVAIEDPESQQLRDLQSLGYLGDNAPETDEEPPPDATDRPPETTDEPASEPTVNPPETSEEPTPGPT